MGMNWEKHGINIRQLRGGKMTCPKCSSSRKPENRKDRCLSVNTENGLFNCHNCNFSGNASDLPVLDKPKKNYTKPQPKLQKVSNKILEWFESRGISNNTLLLAKVTESFEKVEDTEMNMICFNYFRNEELVNIKFRSGNKKFKMVPGAELIFYNLDCLKLKRPYIIIVEGEMDVLTMIECGEFGVLSVPNGASKGQRMEYLDNCWKELEGVEKILIAADSDEPGQALKDELIRRLGPDRCYIPQYPEGRKDANEIMLLGCKNVSEVISKYGIEGLSMGKAAIKAFIASAKQVPIPGMLELYDVQGSLDHMRRYGYPTSYSLGWELDKYLKFRPGEMTVLTGYPNNGKTPFALNITMRLAVQHGWRWAVFCPENMPAHILIGVLVQIYTGCFFHTHDGHGMASDEEYREAKEFIQDHFFFLDTESLDFTVEDLLEIAESLVKRVGIKGFLIDPWNQIEHHIHPGQTEHSFIGEKLGKISKHAIRHSLYYLITAHPAKPVKDKNNKDKMPVPTLADISGSMHWFNKPHNGLVIYRNFETAQTNIYVQKVKWFFVGKQGRANLVFEPAGQRFVDAPVELSPEQQTYEDKKSNMLLAEKNRMKVNFAIDRTVAKAKEIEFYEEPPF